MGIAAAEQQAESEQPEATAEGAKPVKAPPPRRGPSDFVKRSIAILEAAAQNEAGNAHVEGDEENEGEEGERPGRRSPRQDERSPDAEAGEDGVEPEADEGEHGEQDDAPGLALTLDDLIKKAGVDKETFLGAIQVDVQGETVGMRELRDGYLRTKDYTQKTQHLAKAHDEIIPYRDVVGRLKTDEDFQEYVARYFQGAASTLTDVLPYEQIEQLVITDPERARDELGRFRKRETELTKWKNQKAQAKREIEAWKNRQQAVAKSKHPTYDEMRGSILGYLNQRGITEAELNDNPLFEDARIIDILVDAVKGGFAKKTDNSVDDLKLSLGNKREPPKPQRLSSAGASGNRIATDKVRQREVSALREKVRGGDKSAVSAFLAAKYPSPI